MKIKSSTLVASAIGVSLLTLGTHWVGVRNGLINWDDDVYVHTAAQLGGLSAKSVQWAFTALTPFYYHPLTWLSHLTDVTLFGDSLAAQHAVNVGLHALNAGLVVWLVWLLAGRVSNVTDGERLVLAAGIGLVFGIHPLQVESVAWLAERKNVLCGTFSLLCLGTYVRGTNRWLVAGWFAAALLSKPMAVTLPVVMLALDVYPLNRQPLGWRRLLREKIALFALAAGAVVVTVSGQIRWGAMQELSDLTVWQRLFVATRGLAFYVKKIAWPTRLSPYYPLGDQIVIADAEFWLPALLVAAVTVVVVWQRRRVPVGLTAWVAFVALVLPVSGLVQVGAQAVACRFVYLALLPVVLVAGTAGVWFWRKAHAAGRIALGALFAGLLLFQFYATRALVPVWRDEERFWRYVLDCFPDSGIANFHLAMALVEQRRFPEAQPHAQYAVNTIGYNPLAHATLGLVYLKTGQHAKAIPELQIALAREPEFWASRYNLACAYSRVGRLEEAWVLLRDLLSRQPRFARMARTDPNLQALRDDARYGPELREWEPRQ